MSMRPLGLADGAHGVVDAPAAEAGLRDDEGLSLAAEQGLRRHADVLVMDQRVRAVTVGLAGQADVAHDVDAGRVRRAPGTSTCPGRH